MKKKQYSIFLVCSILFCCCKEKSKATKELNWSTTDTCASKKDTSYYITLALDTSTADFNELQQFIETNTEFRVYHKPKEKKVQTDSMLVLKKLLCYTGGYDPRAIYWYFKNIRVMEIVLRSVKSHKGYKNYHPVLYLQQINFANEQDKETALAKLKEIGWGDPEKKWNNYSWFSNKTRIYILYNGDATFQDYDEKYAGIIEKKWIATHPY